MLIRRALALTSLSALLALPSLPAHAGVEIGDTPLEQRLMVGDPAYRSSIGYSHFSSGDLENMRRQLDEQARQLKELRSGSTGNDSLQSLKEQLQALTREVQDNKRELAEQARTIQSLRGNSSSSGSLDSLARKVDDLPDLKRQVSNQDRQLDDLRRALDDLKRQAH